jgi:hypothetical protein
MPNMSFVLVFHQLTLVYNGIRHFAAEMINMNVKYSMYGEKKQATLLGGRMKQLKTDPVPKQSDEGLTDFVTNLLFP